MRCSWSHVIAGCTAVLLCLAAAEPETATRVSTRPSGETFDSLAELQRHYARRLEQARQSVEVERFDALTKFIESASDEQRVLARRSLIESARQLERYDQLAKMAGDFLQDYPDNLAAWTVRNQRLVGLICSGHLNKARQEWEQAAEEPREGPWRQMLAGGVGLTDALIDAGRSEDAKSLLESIRKRFGFVRQLDQFLVPQVRALGWMGKQAPELEGEDLSGRKLDLSAYRGRVVLVDFWATWSQPSLTRLNDLVALYEKYHEQGFDIVSISLDGDPETVERFMARHKLPWRVAVEPKTWEGPNVRRYAVTALPDGFVIGRDGNIARAGLSQRGVEPVVRRLMEKAGQAETQAAPGS